MWKQAKDTVRLLGVTISAFSLINKLAHATDRPREALATIGAISIAVVEGFQQKISVDRLEAAISTLAVDLNTNDNVPLAQFIDRFKEML